MSDNFGEFTVPPGWYPDPADPARLRRWDGEGWTTDVVPVADSATQPVPQPVELEFEPEPVAPPKPEPEPAVVPAPEPEPAPEPAPRRGMEPDFSDWPDLPGLTLPPDLSSIPGMRQESAFPMPNFEDEAYEEPVPDEPAFDLPSFDHPAFDQPARVSPPVFTEPIFTEPEPEPEDAPEPTPPASGSPDTPTEPPAAEPRSRREMRNSRSSSDRVEDDARSPQPAAKPPPAPYAPPPAGVQYIAPLPPGVDNVEPAPNAYPASSLGNRITPSWSDAQPSVPTPAVPPAEPPPVAPVARALRPVGVVATPRSSTLGVWLIAILPLLQFAAVYYAFGLLSEPLVSGVQWGVVAAPAIFALIFASLDGRKLRDQGFQRVPSALWAVIPPLYLLVRCFRIGPRSISALAVWLVFQAAAVAGVYLLLPGVLAEALGTPVAATASTAGSPTSPNGAKPISAATRAEQLTQKGMQAKILNDTRGVFKVQSVKCPALTSTATGTTVVCTAKTKTQTLFLTERVDNSQAFVAFVQTQMKSQD